MIIVYGIWVNSAGWNPNLQSESKIKRKLIEISLHITGMRGEGGSMGVIMTHYVICHVQMTSDDNHTILGRSPKCHMSCLYDIV